MRKVKIDENDFDRNDINGLSSSKYYISITYTRRDNDSYEKRINITFGEDAITDYMLTANSNIERIIDLDQNIIVLKILDNPTSRSYKLTKTSKRLKVAFPAPEDDNDLNLQKRQGIQIRKDQQWEEKEDLLVIDLSEWAKQKKK